MGFVVLQKWHRSIPHCRLLTTRRHAVQARRQLWQTTSSLCWQFYSASEAWDRLRLGMKMESVENAARHLITGAEFGSMTTSRQCRTSCSDCSSPVHDDDGVTCLQHRSQGTSTCVVDDINDRADHLENCLRIRPLLEKFYWGKSFQGNCLLSALYLGLWQYLIDCCWPFSASFDILLLVKLLWIFLLNLPLLKHICFRSSWVLVTVAYLHFRNLLIA